MVPPPTSPSKGAINRAGDLLRAALVRDEDVEQGRLFEALVVVDDYRSKHQQPLTTAAMGLRSSVKTAGAPIKVSQRLKRFPTIVDKLCREEALQLSRMQDIGGCRAVLPGVDAVRAVQRRLEARGRRCYRRTKDYIEQPRASGYRAVHVILRYHELDIEVQLRTEIMHDWAIAVERFGSRLNEDLKSGNGPSDVLEWLAAVSEAMAYEDHGEVVPNDLAARIGDLRLGAVPYLTMRSER